MCDGYCHARRTERSRAIARSIVITRSTRAAVVAKETAVKLRDADTIAVNIAPAASEWPYLLRLLPERIRQAISARMANLADYYYT